MNIGRAVTPIPFDIRVVTCWRRTALITYLEVVIAVAAARRARGWAAFAAMETPTTNAFSQWTIAAAASLSSALPLWRLEVDTRFEVHDDGHDIGDRRKRHRRPGAGPPQRVPSVRMGAVEVRAASCSAGCRC